MTYERLAISNVPNLMPQPENQPHAGGKHLIHDEEKSAAINTITSATAVVTMGSCGSAT